MTSRDRPQGPGDSPGFLLWGVTLAWQRQVTAALRPLGLTHVQFVLLASTHWLTRDGGSGPSQRELADQAGTDIMMTSTVVRTLERAGLVERHPDPADARVKRLAPTSAGHELAETAMVTVEAVDRDFFARAGDPRCALALLQQLAAPRDE